MRKAQSRSNALTQHILHYLRLKKCKAWRNNNGAVYDPTKKIFRSNSSTPGISDIAGILPGGRALYIEVKVGRDKLSQEQIQFLEDVNRMGGLAFEARSLDDVIDKIDNPVEKIDYKAAYFSLMAEKIFPKNEEKKRISKGD